MKIKTKYSYLCVTIAIKSYGVLQKKKKASSKRVQAPDIASFRNVMYI